MVIKGSVRKANFVQHLNAENKLETGPLGEGSRKTVDLTLSNPTEGDVEIRLFLGTEKMMDLENLIVLGKKKILMNLGIET